LGIGTAIQGAIFFCVSDVTLPAAFRVADMLYAEEFDRSGVVPAWFGPWRLASRHSSSVEVIFLMSGVALVIAGVRFAARGLGVQQSLERVLLPALICSSTLAIALIPLSNGGSDWGSGTSAHNLKRTVVASAVAVWLEWVLLLTTIVIVRRMRTPFASGMRRAERATWRIE
jgi:hypothetical protein